MLWLHASAMVPSLQILPIHLLFLLNYLLLALHNCSVPFRAHQSGPAIKDILAKLDSLTKWIAADSPSSFLSVCASSSEHMCPSPVAPHLHGPAVSTFIVPAAQPPSSQDPLTLLPLGCHQLRDMCLDARSTVLFSVFFLACLYLQRKLFLVLCDQCIPWLLLSPLESPDQQLERKCLMLRTGALLGSLWLLEGPLSPQELSLHLNTYNT